MEDESYYTWGSVSDTVTYAPPYTVTSSGAPMPLTISGTGTVSSGNTITVTGTTTGGYVTSPNTSHQWNAVTPFLKHDVIRIQTKHGSIAVKYDGSVEYPDELEDAAKEFWDKLGTEISQYFLDAVRKEAARQVREILPRLVPELEPYRASLMQLELAMAIKMDQK